MYWNGQAAYKTDALPAINRNMRCIEINEYDLDKVEYVWLIETWDVLKLGYVKVYIAFDAD